jgi:high-affinity nickel permease
MSKRPARNVVLIMLSALSIVTLGFFLGMRHATDADHVVAVSTIVSRERSIWRAAGIGALWGVGHTLTILVVGGAIIFLKLEIPPRIGLSMELGVGVMLVLLGLVNLTGIVDSTKRSLALVRGWRAWLHWHPFSGGGTLAPHRHGDTSREEVQGERSVLQSLRPLAIGVVHGLAGSAAITLLVLATIRNAVWAAAYLLVFGIGTVAGMVLVTTTIALPFMVAGQRFAQPNRRLQVVTGLLSVGFGLFLAYKIGFVNGLFSSSPTWTPQ